MLTGTRTKRSKSPDKRHSRKKYWASRVLENHKVDNLLKNHQPAKKVENPWTGCKLQDFGIRLVRHVFQTNI